MLLMALLLVAWQRGVNHRCSDPLIRRNIMLITIMLVLWMLVVPIKYGSGNDLLNSLLWYYFYVPLCMAPMLGLECGLRTAGLDASPAARRFMIIAKGIGIALVALVFTNNLHHLVFAFDFADPDWSSDYTYCLGYGIIIGWIALTMLAYVAVLYYAAHRTRRLVVAQLLVLMGLFVLYAVCYVTKVLPRFFHNLSFSYCLLIVALVEFCLRSGLLLSYSGYDAAFAHLPFDVRIFSRQGQLVEQSGHAEDISSEALVARLRPGTVILEDEQLTCKHIPLPGGVAVVVENIAELNDRRRTLAQGREELARRNAVLTNAVQVRTQLARLQSEQALQDEIEQALSHSLGRVQALLDTLPGTETAEQRAARQTSLHQIKLLLSYGKRQGGLILMGKDDPMFDEERLALALNETASDLRTSGVECGVLTQVTRVLSCATTSAFYDCVYNLGALALLVSQPEMLMVVRAVEGEPATLKLALESPTLRDLPRWALDDLRAELDSVAVETTVTWENDTVYVNATGDLQEVG